MSDAIQVDKYAGNGLDQSSSSDPSGSQQSSSFNEGPSGDHHTAAAAANEKRQQETLNAILFPADTYTEDQTYWADLPFMEKTKWINKQSNEEAKRELVEIGRMFKEDPLSPIRAYFSNYVVTGMGLFTEGYVLFSVGNLNTLFKSVWPHCFGQKGPVVCDAQWLHAIDYLEIVGIIFGQIAVGIEGDWIGRRFGLVQDALVMLLGTIMLTAMWGTSLNGWVICYAWSVFIYGIGVGGEYPMTSTRAMEGSGSGIAASTGDRMHRGRKVALAFTMQGWGQLANQAVLIILLLVFHGSVDAPFGKTSTQWVFRVSFAVIAIPTLYLAYLRYYKFKFTDNALRAAKAKNTSGYSWATLKMAVGHYWHRLIGTAVVWFINDVLFYGSKIFSGVFISQVVGGSSGSSLEATWLYNLVNVGVSMVGYYMGALLVDHKQYGRKWMQINGLLMIAILFAICAGMWATFNQKGNLPATHAFMGLYFCSSFFTQFGPNVTSFLLAAEVYPAIVRSTAHGVSAATGKCGALLAAVLYNYIDNRTKFFVVFPFGFAGALITFIFVPDVTSLDLREQERYYQYVLEGRQHEYHGVAVHPRHLSLFERVVLKRHLAYDPEKDRAQKINELRNLYQDTKAQEVSTEKGGNGKNKEDLSEDQKMLLDYELEGFFANEEKLRGYLTRNTGTSNNNRPHPSRLANLENKLN